MVYLSLITSEHHKLSLILLGDEEIVQGMQQLALITDKAK